MQKRTGTSGQTTGEHHMYVCMHFLMSVMEKRLKVHKLEAHFCVLIEQLASELMVNVLIVLYVRVFFVLLIRCIFWRPAVGFLNLFTFEFWDERNWRDERVTFCNEKLMFRRVFFFLLLFFIMSHTGATVTHYDLQRQHMALQENAGLLPVG